MAAHRSTRGKRRFDDDGWTPSSTTDHSPVADLDDPDDRDDPVDHDDPVELDDGLDDEPAWSSYRDATKGPEPVPAWVVTDPRAIDTDHGVLKTGKEADVSLLDRRLTAEHADGDAEQQCWLAVKQYRSAEHRMFHRDAGYLEGRRVRRSREMRAMATRTEFGRELIAGQWAHAEFAVLSRLWQAGAAVPYPVQLIGTELMMEFIGADGVAAPRLAQVRPDRYEAAGLYEQMRKVLRRLADAGYAHGDLSSYNVLVDDGRIVLIDLPQAVDLVGNPQGFAYLRRDCDNICTWFAAHGAPHADPVELTEFLLRSVPGFT
jgi:RIO kinase 1